MNKGSSAAIGSGGHSVDTSAAASSYQRSRSPIGTSAPVARITSTRLRLGARKAAASTLAFSGIALPPRRPKSAVTTSLESQSSIRPASASGEKPPNTTEWIAPIRAQASTANAASGIIGR